MRQFVVIGLGRFGSSIARALSALDFDVLAIDKDESLGPVPSARCHNVGAVGSAKSSSENE